MTLKRSRVSELVSNLTVMHLMSYHILHWISG